jgi:hypothetical protein
MAFFPHLSAPFRTFPHLNHTRQIRTATAPPHHPLKGCGGAVRKVGRPAEPIRRTAPDTAPVRIV